MNRLDDYKMPFGKFKGKTLDTIASTDNGLRYLDWMIGALDDLPPQVENYCERSDVAKAIERQSNEQKRVPLHIPW